LLSLDRVDDEVVQPLNPDNFPLVFKQGSTKIITARYTIPSRDVNGNVIRNSYGQVVRVPVDLSAYTARFVGRKRTEVTPEFDITQVSTADGGIVLDALGHLIITVTDEKTASMTTGGLYVLEIMSGGATTRLLKGYYTLSKDVV
jgi:hypothetical protein